MSYTNKHPEIASRSSSQGFSTSKLKEMIEEEVFDILTGIKQQIETKFKQVDRNISMLKNQIIDLKKSTQQKVNSVDTSDITKLGESMKILLAKVDKIEKEIIAMKNSSNLSDLSYLHNGQASKSNISTYKLSQVGEKSTSKQRNNSPLFKKINNQNIDLSALIFQQEKPNKYQSEEVSSFSLEVPTAKTQKKTSIFANTQNLKKPPLPFTDMKPKANSYSQNSTSSTFYQQIRDNQVYRGTRSNTMINPNIAQTVEKELSKNKNVFLRKKKSEQKIQQPQPQKTSYRFENQLQDFGQKEDESFNIELQYSKDTFLEDL